MKKIILAFVLIFPFYISCHANEPLDFTIYWQDETTTDYYFSEPQESLIFQSISFIGFIDHIEVRSGAEQVKSLYISTSDEFNEKTSFLDQYSMFANLEYLSISGFIFTNDDLDQLYKFKNLKTVEFHSISEISMSELDLSSLNNLKALKFSGVADWYKINPVLSLPQSVDYVELNEYPNMSSNIMAALEQVERVVILLNSPTIDVPKTHPSNFEWLWVDYYNDEKTPFEKMVPDIPDMNKGYIPSEDAN